MPPHRASIVVRSLCWAGILLLLAAYACLFRRYAVDLPQTDDYAQILAVPYYFSQQSALADRVQYVLSLSVEHRIATLRLAARAEATLFGGLDFVALMLLGATMLACAVALIVLETPPGHRAWVALVATAMFVSPVNYEAQFWATGALQHFGVLGLSLSALWCFARASPTVRAAGIALAIAAALTSANGLMTLPAAAAMAWWAGRRREAALAALVTVGAFAIYFAGFDASGTAASALAHPLAIGRFLPIAFGSLMVDPLAAMVLGLALIAAWIWLARRRARLPPVVIGWVCFLAASYAAMAVGRAGLGEDAALLSRYRPYSATLVLVTLVALLHAMAHPRRTALGAIAVPVVLAWFAATWVLMLPVVAMASLGQEIARATYLATGHGVYVPWPPQEYGDFHAGSGGGARLLQTRARKRPGLPRTAGANMAPVRMLRFGQSSVRGSRPMPMLPARHYVSEHTQFIRELMKEKPDLARQQREGRAIWWDKTPRELTERTRMDERSVPQRPYVYGDE